VPADQPQPTKSQKPKNAKKSKKEPRQKEEKEHSKKVKEKEKEKEKENLAPKEKVKEKSNVEEVEEELTKEIKDADLELNKEKEKKNNFKLECTHKEGFSLEGNQSNKKNSNPSPKENEEKGETIPPDFNNMNNAYYPFYMFNPMMMNPTMDSKGQVNPMFCFYPVPYDPSKMPKDMNGQNMGYYPPMMGMYPQYYADQGFMQNTKK
jgi:hypothetical protein